MKKRKLLSTFLLVAVSVFFIAGCNSDKSNNKKIEDKNSDSNIKTKCEFYECINKIEPENTIEEMNEIIGIDAVKTSDEYNYYEYDFGNDRKIILKFYYDDKPTIEVKYNKKDLKNDKVTLKNLSALKSRINDGITYEEFKKEVGGVDGTLIEKSTSSKNYIWVNENEGNVKATFDKKGKCTFFFGADY